MLGWAYDLRSVSKELIEKRALRTGDGSRYQKGAQDGLIDTPTEHVWGWLDVDMTDDRKRFADIRNKCSDE